MCCNGNWRRQKKIITDKVIIHANEVIVKSDGPTSGPGSRGSVGGRSTGKRSRRSRCPLGQRSRGRTGRSRGTGRKTGGRSTGKRRSVGGRSTGKHRKGLSGRRMPGTRNGHF